MDVLDHPEQFKGDVDDVIKRFSSQHIAEEYEALFQELIESRKICNVSVNS